MAKSTPYSKQLTVTMRALNKAGWEVARLAELADDETRGWLRSWERILDHVTEDIPIHGGKKDAP